MNGIINLKYFFILMIYALLTNCKAKVPAFYFVNKRLDAVNSMKKKVAIRKDYYIVKNYKNNFSTNAKLDSLALSLGRIKGGNYDLYFLYFFTSRHSIKSDSIFFKKNDSLTLSKKRNNLANYLFVKGFFREKQRLKRGKIMPPLYDSVYIKSNNVPMFEIDFNR